MGLSVFMQDQVLNWFRGRRVAPTPDMLWLSFHNETPASSLNETSVHFGGRIALIPGDLSEPISGDHGLREITNLRALVSQPVDEQEILKAVGIWDSQLGGQLLLGAVYEPELVIRRGNPAVLLAEHLKLRATA